MGKQILKVLLSGLVVIMILPFFIVAATLSLLFASLVGVPLTAPGPPVVRYHARVPADQSARRPAPAEAAPALIESASVS